MFLSECVLSKWIYSENLAGPLPWPDAWTVRAEAVRRRTLDVERREATAARAPAPATDKPGRCLCAFADGWSFWAHDGAIVSYRGEARVVEWDSGLYADRMRALVKE